MKHLLVAAIYLASIAFGQEFVYEDNTYQLVQMGNQHVVYPRSIKLRPVDTGTLQPIDCDALFDRVSRNFLVYESCNERPTSSFCQLQKDDAAFQSREEYFQEPPLFYPAERSWRLLSPPVFSKHNALKDFVAEHFAVDKELIAVELMLPEQPMTLAMTAQDDSLIAKVMEIMPLTPGVLEEFRLAGNHILVDNRFLACDLEDKKLQLSSSAKFRVTFTETVSAEKLRMVWKFYERVRSLMTRSVFEPLPRLVQASLVAFELSVVANQTSISPRELLRKLFVMRDWDMELRQFSSADDLEEKVFPPVNHTRELEFSWSTE